MSWFKVDDRFWSHPKTGDLSDGATALWLRAGSWSAGHLTDGLIPKGMLRMFRARQRSVDELVAAGLWVPASGSGEALVGLSSGSPEAYLFHDWDDYQPSREAVTARREATRSRVNAWREKQSNGVTSTDDAQSGNAAPDPTRPDPTVVPDGTTERGARKRATSIPDPFLVTSQMREWAAENTPLIDVDKVTVVFVDYWRGKSGKDATKRDWVATWRNWLRRDNDRAEERGVKPTAFDRAVNVVHMYKEGETREEVGNRPALGSGGGGR